MVLETVGVGGNDVGLRWIDEGIAVGCLAEVVGVG
jgi:hypothetical protein